MRNIQSRVIEASPEAVGELLDLLASERDRVWPSPTWPSVRLDDGLRIGSRGGHGPIRYHVAEYEPGRRVRFVFDAATGITGFHELRVDVAGSCVRLVHELRGRTRAGMMLRWPLAFRWLHEAMSQDLLDRAEWEVTGRLGRSSRHSVGVRLLRWRFGARPQATEVSASLVTRGANLADAWRLPLAAGMPTDPQVWADAIFRDPPRWVVALLVLRNGLVRLIGVPPAGRSVFDTIANDGREVLLGADEVHLDFRSAVTIAGRAVVLSTVATATNARGRLYLGVVRRVHPMVVRGMLARANRRLAKAASYAGAR